MLIVAIVVVAIAGYAVFRLHGVFGSNHDTSTAEALSDEIIPFNPKHVVLEVFGPPGTVAMPKVNKLRTYFGGKLKART